MLLHVIYNSRSHVDAHALLFRLQTFKRMDVNLDDYVSWDEFKGPKGEDPHQIDTEDAVRAKEL